MAATADAPRGWHCWRCQPEGPTPADPRLATADGQPTSPLDQIRQLAALRDEGVLSDEEFQTKKAELLRRL
jgi:hypothetical protein